MSPYQIHLIDFAENVFEIRDLHCAGDSEAIDRAITHDFPRYAARFEVWHEERLVAVSRLCHCRGTINFVAGEHGPGDARRLVGHRYGDDARGSALEERAQP